MPVNRPARTTTNRQRAAPGDSEHPARAQPTHEPPQARPDSASTNARRRQTLARRAEQAVAEYLVECGIQLVATNLHLGHLEIDIVARDGDTIAVVEVRFRGKGAWTSPFGSVSRSKRNLLRRAGRRLWQDRYRHDPSVSRLRFDVASVRFIAGVSRIEYARAAF